MINLNFFDNYQDAVCVFSENKEIIFRNKLFQSAFPMSENLQRFKKHFNFNLCFLSTDKIKEITPLDILLESKENFHTICTYQSSRETFLTYYLYSFLYENYKVVRYSAT